MDPGFASASQPLRQTVVIRLNTLFQDTVVTTENYGLLFSTALREYLKVAEDQVGPHEDKEQKRLLDEPVCIANVLAVLDTSLSGAGALKTADTPTREHVQNVLRTSGSGWLQVLLRALREGELVSIFEQPDHQDVSVSFSDPLSLPTWQYVKSQPQRQVLSVAKWIVLLADSLSFLKQQHSPVIPLERQRKIATEVVRAIVKRALRNPTTKPQVAVREQIERELPVALETLLGVYYPTAGKPDASSLPHERKAGMGTGRRSGNSKTKQQREHHESSSSSSGCCVVL